MAKRKIKIGGFRTPIWKACSDDGMRSALQCVSIKNGYVYATNAHIVIKQSLENIHDITGEQAEALEGKLIHKDVVKYLMSCENVIFRNDYIDVVNGNFKLKIEYSDLELIYPNIENILKGFKKEAKSEIGFTTKNLETLYATMAGTTGQVKLMFNKGHGYIKIIHPSYEEQDQMGILMPVVLTD